MADWFSNQEISIQGNDEFHLQLQAQTFTVKQQSHENSAKTVLAKEILKYLRTKYLAAKYLKTAFVLLKSFFQASTVLIFKHLAFLFGIVLQNWYYKQKCYCQRIDPIIKRAKATCLIENYSQMLPDPAFLPSGPVARY